MTLLTSNRRMLQFCDSYQLRNHRKTSLMKENCWLSRAAMQIVDSSLLVALRYEEVAVHIALFFLPIFESNERRQW